MAPMRAAPAGLANFRDFGGGRTGDGRRLSRGRLYRSAHLAGLEAEGIEDLARLDLGLIVDLRSPGERKRDPSRLPAGFAGHVLAEPARDEAGEALHVSALATALLEGAPAREIMIASYRKAPFAADRVTLFRTVFDRLAETRGAVLIHCTAGKDRTGLLAALIQRLLGVHADDILADYLRSLDAFEALTEALAGWLAAHGLSADRIDPALLRPLIGVDAAYLEAGFAAIDDEHGSIEGYFRDRLGIDDALRARIETALLV